MLLPDLHAVVLAYLADGWLRDPAMAGLRSFEHAELAARGFDIIGPPHGLALYEDQRRFRRAGRVVQGSFKVFLEQGHFHGNGLDLGYQLRLAGVLRAARGQALPLFKVLLRRDASWGALLFDNGLVLHFAANLRGTPRHYFLTIVEGSVPAPPDSELDLRAASQAHADVLYATYTPAELQRLAHRGHAPLRELIRELRSLR